jgi:hypothetical protein
MECEATYHDDQRCPPLVGLVMLESRTDLTARDRRKISKLRTDAATL